MRWGIGRGEKGRKEVGTEREKEREWERESQYSICWNLFFKVSYFNGYVNFFKPVSTHNLMVRKAGRWRKRTSTSQLHWPLPALPPIYLSGPTEGGKSLHREEGERSKLTCSLQIWGEFFLQWTGLCCHLSLNGFEEFSTHPILMPKVTNDFLSLIYIRGAPSSRQMGPFPQIPQLSPPTPVPTTLS